MKVLRDGKEITLHVTVAELPGEQVAKAETEDKGSGDTLNGVAVADIDSGARSQFNIPPRVHGVVVTQVDQDSAAAAQGLQPGDVIMEINRKPVQNADEAVKLTSNVKDKNTLLKVCIQGRQPLRGRGRKQGRLSAQCCALPLAHHGRGAWQGRRAAPSAPRSEAAQQPAKPHPRHLDSARYYAGGDIAARCPYLLFCSPAYFQIWIWAKQICEFWWLRMMRKSPPSWSTA